VATTRAQALLIVIGDPEVLGKYEHWRTFLQYVKSRQGYTGKMCDWEHEPVDPPSEYEIFPRTGGVLYGDEFIGGKSEKIYSTLENSGEMRKRQF
jgi:helicase MOV-10